MHETRPYPNGYTCVLSTGWEEVLCKEQEALELCKRDSIRRIVHEGRVEVIVGADLVYPMNDQAPLFRALAAVRESHPAVPIMLAVACRERTTQTTFLQHMQLLGEPQELVTEHEWDALYGRTAVKLYRV